MLQIARKVIETFKKSIQLRLLVSFLAILIPLMVVSLLMSGRFQSILETETSERVTSALSSVMGYVDLTLASLDELSVLISTDQNLLQLLNKEEELTPATVIDFTTVLSQITSLTAHNRIINQMAIYHEPSRMMISSSFGGRPVSDGLLDQLHELSIRLHGGRFLYVPDGHPQGTAVPLIMEPYYDPGNIVFGRLMDLNQVYRVNHLLLMTVKKEQWVKLFQNLVPAESQTVIYLLSDQDELIASTDRNAKHPPLMEEAFKNGGIGKVPDFEGEWFRVRVYSPVSKWSLILMQPEEELGVHTKPIRQFTYLIIAVSLLFAVSISWIMYSQISSPLSKLSTAMRLMHLGKRDVEIQTDRMDEFGHITRVFNQMARENRHLIEDIYEHRLRLTQTELKFLQSQINPHFLYNTLDCIYWMSKNYEADEIGTMVLNLSRFFRLSLNSGGETFTVAETIEHLKYYLIVQQIRFGESFIVEYEVQEEAQSVSVLKLILQPFVENAIIHGLESLTLGGKLRIIVKLQGMFLVAIVEDNGVGIPEDRLLHLNEELTEINEGVTPVQGPGVRVADFFGLKNVKMRLRLYYGSNADIRIESKAGDGTKVTVTIPLKGEQHEAVNSGG
jgi:two-component system sensor histidine kinase YesM